VTLTGIKCNFFVIHVIDIKKPIKVFARARPFNDDELAREERRAVQTFNDAKKVWMLLNP